MAFPPYIPKDKKKEPSLEELMKNIQAQQALIEAYCNISGNGMQKAHDPASSNLNSYLRIFPE